MQNNANTLKHGNQHEHKGCRHTFGNPNFIYRSTLIKKKVKSVKLVGIYVYYPLFYGKEGELKLLLNRSVQYEKCRYACQFEL